MGFLAAWAVLMAAALATGAPVYLLLATVLLLLVLISLVSVLWALWSLHLEIKGLRPRLNRGDNLTTILNVRHASLLPVAAVRIQMNVPSAYSTSQEISLSIPPFKKRTYRHVIRCMHRGVYEVGVSRFRARDLFGLFTVSRKSGLKLLQVDVYPRVSEVLPMELRASDVGPELVSRASEDASSPSDVRKWQDGDELKKVHWKLTMRKKELMVRTFEESARPDTLIIPDLSSIAALSDQALTIEDCICEACVSAAQAQLNAGYPVRMPLTCARPSEITGQFPQDFPMFLDAMMRVAFDSPYAYEQVLALMLGRMQRTGGAVLVTSKLTTRVADAAERLARSGILTKLIWVTDTRRAESLEMIGRLRMEGVMVEMANPWSEAGYAAAQTIEVLR